MVRTAASIARNYGYDRPPKYNLVIGVESGMPADPELLPYVLRFVVPGRALERDGDRAQGDLAAAPARRRARRRSAHRPRGTVHLPDGSRASSNGDLVKELVAIAREAGRAIASPEEARVALKLSPRPKEARP